ncbi:MAG: hypothetical protein A4E29_01411 [Methanomassiliicoccales archaeon PtaB.Bin134]|jgi:hypothetical protein|nr:MAG: hypothetical protein A4E29_01411 [Methanomassiliicoccales archaeon PtaB.Bin134]
MSKPVTVEWGLEISAVMTVSAVVLLLIGLSDVLEWWFDLGGWGFYLGAVGILLLIVGVIWFASILNRIKRFKVLMLEKSKAAFVRSLDDLEYTAWRLPSKYDSMVMEKKREMGVR